MRANEPRKAIAPFNNLNLLLVSFINMNISLKS